MRRSPRSYEDYVEQFSRDDVGQKFLELLENLRQARKQDEEMRAKIREQLKRLGEARRKAGVHDWNSYKEYDRKKVEYYKKQPRKNNPLYE